MNPEKMIEDANATLRLYNETLDRATKMGEGVPESMLPFPREQIKNALLVAYFCDPDAHFREQLKLAYLYLAEFIPDEEAKLSLKVSAAVNNDDAAQLHALGPATLDRWRSSRNAVKANMQRLSREFDQRVSRIGK
jgi:hypothetical protein